MREITGGEFRQVGQELNLQKWALVAALVLVPVAARLVPYWWHFMPLTAVAIFAGAWFTDWRLKLGIPLAARLLSDAALGYDMAKPSEVLFIYACLVVSVLLGWMIRRRRQQVLAPLAASLTSAVVFFLVTNFGVWLESTPSLGPYYYPRTLAGLVTCYEMALPFFRSTLIGDVVYTVALFAGYAWACQWSPRLAEIPGQETA
jgi:hypothetical protein